MHKQQTQMRFGVAVLRHTCIRAALAVLLLIGMTTISACKKNYLTDGGLATAVTPLSNYDYLQGNADHYFDTVLMVIDHFNLKDSVNLAGTFFAPTDFSITSLLNAYNWTSLDSLYAHTTSKFLTQYMFTDTSMSLYGATTTPTAYTNWADTVCGLKETAQSYGVVNTVFTYDILQYIKINGQLDPASGPVGSDPADAVLNCQTTGIKTNNGKNTLNVFANNASLYMK